MNIVYIIGNGFDLNLGLKTKYTDFYNYYFKSKSNDKDVEKLQKHISSNYKYWADLELGLGEYSDYIKDPKEFIKVVEDLADKLADYLTKEQQSFSFKQINQEKFFKDLSFPELQFPNADKEILTNYKNKWSLSNWDITILTLNYTTTLEEALGIKDKSDLTIGNRRNTNKIVLKNVHHIHGYINDRMILGVNEKSQIKNKDFHDLLDINEAFVKPICNKASKQNIDKLCIDCISSADLICIYGTSIGDTDKIWWQQIGKQLRRNIKILIFCKNEYELSERRPYKRGVFEREIKDLFLSKTSLTNFEKEQFYDSIFVDINTKIFSF